MFSRTPRTHPLVFAIFPINRSFQVQKAPCHTSPTRERVDKDLWWSWSTNKSGTKEEQRVLVSEQWPHCLTVFFTFTGGKKKSLGSMHLTKLGDIFKDHQKLFLLSSDKAYKEKLHILPRSKTREIGLNLHILLLEQTHFSTREVFLSDVNIILGYGILFPLSSNCFQGVSLFSL